MKRQDWYVAIAGGCLSTTLAVQVAQASTITIANPVAPSATPNFTTEGTYDWISYGSGPSSANNVMSGGGTISSLGVIQGGSPTVSNAGSFYPIQISYTNGTNPATSTSTTGTNTATHTFDFVGSTGTNDGLDFTATIPALTTETLNVYVITYDPSAVSPQTPENFVELEASFPGATSQTNTGTLFASNSGYSTGDANHAVGEYTVTVSNTASSAQNLTIDYATTSAGTASSNIGIYGVDAAIAPVPEPAMLGVISLAGCALLARRKRQSA